jgi:hypothetical protein
MSVTVDAIDLSRFGNDPILSFQWVKVLKESKIPARSSQVQRTSKHETEPLYQSISTVDKVSIPYLGRQHTVISHILTDRQQSFHELV